MGDHEEDSFVTVYITMAFCFFPSFVMSTIYLASFSYLVPQLETFSITNGDKITIDWNTPLISDIYVKESYEPCDLGDDPAIFYPWFGSNHMCIDDVDKDATRGFTCAVGNLEYRS